MTVRSITLVCLAVLVPAAVARSAGAQSPPAGKASFDRVCSVCHGADAHGDAAPGLVPLEHDVDEVMVIVREGRGQMPPVSPERLTDDEIKQIVAYLKSLDTAPPAGPK